jgi:hypothetical protein
MQDFSMLFIHIRGKKGHMFFDRFSSDDPLWFYLRAARASPLIMALSRAEYERQKKRLAISKVEKITG